jgi:hypothetical protein
VEGKSKCIDIRKAKAGGYRKDTRVDGKEHGKGRVDSEERGKR